MAKKDGGLDISGANIDGMSVSIVVMQPAIAFGMGQLGFGYWWVSLLIAFCVGAFGNHVL